MYFFENGIQTVPSGRFRVSAWKYKNYIRFNESKGRWYVFEYGVWILSLMLEKEYNQLKCNLGKCDKNITEFEFSTLGPIYCLFMKKKTLEII